MKITALIFSLIILTQLEAQKNVAVYTHNGSKIIGTVVSRDSVNGFIKVRVLGGSEFAIAFAEIDSIKKDYAIGKHHYGQPYFGIGLGASINADKAQFQFDIMSGYQFTNKIQAGLGFCASEVIAGYVDFRYFLFHKSFFAIGLYTQPGIVLTGLRNDYWYYSNGKTTGFYSNTGVSLKLYGGRTSSFSLNLGYQYIGKKEQYTWWNGQKVTYIYNLNRYMVQGVFSF